VKGSLTAVRPGVWRLRVYVGSRPTGTPIQRSRTFRGGKRAAETELAKFVAYVEKRELGRGDVTVGDLLERWLEHGQRKPSTLKGYRSHIRHRISPALGAIRLDRLTSKTLDDTYRLWLADGFSATSVHQCHAILAAALHQAVDWEWTERAVTDHARPPAPSKARPVIPSPDDLKRILLGAAGDPVLATGIALAAATGARRGELCALRWSDVDGDTLTIARSLTVLHGEGAAMIMGDTKTHQERTIALDGFAQAVVVTRREQQRQLAAQAAVVLCSDPFLLSPAVDGGEPCKPDRLTNGFKRTASRLGMDYHLHQCRHFSATTAIGAGVDVRAVASRGGWADPSMMLRVYARPLQEQDRRAAAAVGRALSPG
jgi:integrase